MEVKLPCVRGQDSYSTPLLRRILLHDLLLIHVDIHDPSIFKTTLVKQKVKNFYPTNAKSQTAILKTTRITTNPAYLSPSNANNLQTYRENIETIAASPIPFPQPVNAPPSWGFASDPRHPKHTDFWFPE